MKKILLFALAAGLLTACVSKEECHDPQTLPDQAICINGTIAEIEHQSRTVFTGSTAAWTDGDVIGVFSPQAKGTTLANNPFTITGATWAPGSPIYWADGTTSHKFVAYAPYASGSNTYTAIPLPVLSGQTGSISPAKDFLYSKNQWPTGVTRSGAAVSLVFAHALSLIEFDITIGNGVATGTTLTSFVLASPTSTDKIYSTDATSTIDISTGTITAGTTSNTTTVTPGTPPTLSSTAKSVYALILPGTFTAPTLAITLSESAITINVPATALATTTFAAGSKYTYAVTVSRTAITISAPTITDWTAVAGGSLNPGI